MKMTVVSVATESLQTLREWYDRFLRSYPERELQLCTWYVAREDQIRCSSARMMEDIRTADLVLIDLMGCSEDMINSVGNALEECHGNRIVIGYGCRDKTRLGSFSMGSGMGSKKDPGPNGKGALKTMTRMRKMAAGMEKFIPSRKIKDMNNVFRIGDYWQSGLPQDIASMMDLLLRNYYGWKELPKPAPPHLMTGVYLCDPHDRTAFRTPSEYWAVYPKKEGLPTVAFLFLGHTYPNNLFPVIGEAMNQFSSFSNVLPVGFSSQLDRDIEALRELLLQENVKLVVNFLSFRLGAGPMGGNAEAGVELLRELGVPVINPFYLSRTGVEEWKNSSTGASPGDFLISMMMPELDGGIDTVPVAAVGEIEERELVALPGRLERVAGQAKRLLSLQQKSNSDKKIALICYNYPPGEENLFHAAFLDALASIPELLQTLQEAGYQTEVPESAELLERFVRQGETEVQYGNVLIGVQPYRSPEHYHDRHCPPAAEYVEFYRRCREKFGADALVHLGTHGTLEFLPGKDNGLSANCWPDQLVGDLPNFYYYYCGNPSEGMTAKRRSYATLLTYAGPAFSKSGLYGELAELDDELAEYSEAKGQAPERAAAVWEGVERKAKALGLPTEPNALERELYREKTALIPNGLHILDKTEQLALIGALDGKYVPVGPMGNVHKEPDILPTGRNGYAFDPRFVPSESAYKRGQEIGKAAMERYYNDHGKWPRHTAMVLWGLETAKTHGESIGQLMYYLGLRMVWKGTSFLSRIEVIPTEELDRPRMDVTVTICGFFRDLFPQLLLDLQHALRELAALQENPEQSAFAEQTEKYYHEFQRTGMEESMARELSISRFFGPRQGEYGTSLTDVVKSGDWNAESDLSSLYTAELGYVYSEKLKGSYVPGFISGQLSSVEMISQVRDDADYEVTDLDHYYEFTGGLQRAAKAAGAEETETLIVDTAGEGIYADTLAEAASRGVRTRILNPKWINGQLAHPFHGGQQIMNRFENVLGLAATAECIPGETFSRMEQTYVGDPELRRRMQDNNRYAYLAVLDRLLEANRRGYWDASKEQLQEIQDAYLETEGELEDEV